MNIILYTKTGCPWCQDVIELLESKNILFQERNCTENKDHFDELVQKSGQFMTPTLDIDGVIIADSDADSVAAHLKSRGVQGF